MSFLDPFGDDHSHREPGFFSFIRGVAATGSISEGYLVSISGRSPKDWSMRTEIMREDAQGKGPKRLVIHQGRGPAAERDYWGGRWGADIRDTARDTSPKRVETDWEQPYGHPDVKQGRGWFW